MKDKQKKAPRFSASVSQLHLKGRKRNLRHLIELRVHIFNNTLAMQGWNPRKRHRINIFILIFLYLEAEVEQSVLLLTKNPPLPFCPAAERPDTETWGAAVFIRGELQTLCIYCHQTTSRLTFASALIANAVGPERGQRRSASVAQLHTHCDPRCSNASFTRIRVDGKIYRNNRTH